MTLGKLLYKEHQKTRAILEETSPINSHKNGTTTLYSLLRDIHKFPYNSGNYSSDGEAVRREIVPLLRELIKPHRWNMLTYYLNNGAATVWSLRFHLNITKTTAYRYHTLLEETGLIEQKTKILPIGTMKRPATIWGIPTATEKQIKAAYQMHLDLASPIYRRARKIAKGYLDEGRSIKVTRRNMIDYLKDINEAPRMRRDLADLLVKIINEGGASQ